MSKALEHLTRVAEETLQYLLGVMMEFVNSERFTMIEAKPPESSFFGFAEYLASFALLLLVLASSDFRFRFRLACATADLRAIGSWLAISIGLALLLIDVWYQNALPIPRFISNANNLKAILAFVFLFFVYRVLSNAFLRPPVFGPKTAATIFDAAHQFILEGDAERVRIVAEELNRSIPKVIDFAAKKVDLPKSTNGKLRTEEFAENLLLLFADLRFCRIVVDKAPLFAIICIREVQKNPRKGRPMLQFVRNIGSEFIINKNSSFYQEISGYDSGYLGYSRPVTNAVFGSYRFVENCAEKGFSPLEVGFGEISDFDAIRINGFVRASLAFVEAYLKEGGYVHSYALNQIFLNLEGAVGGTYRLNGVESFHKMPELDRLQESISFIRKTIDLVDEHYSGPRKLHKSNQDEDICDLIAKFLFTVIFHSSAVEGPPWTAWDVQHNTVWSMIFGLHQNRTTKVVGFKLRRLFLDEIRHMTEFANYKGARAIGFILHIFGPVLRDKKFERDREFSGLHKIVIKWLQKNYLEMRRNSPKVADACLLGSISFDETSQAIVKTYMHNLGVRPREERLELR